MPESWQYPVSQPLFTDSLAREIVEDARQGGNYVAKAADTRLRFSDAGKCGRQIAYGVLGVEPEQWDPASLHVAHMGTLYHELLQAAIQRRYPGAQIEVTGDLRPFLDNSGHADALMTTDTITAIVKGWNGGDVLYELKTKSSYQFDKAVGVMRKGWKRGTPAGPGFEVILQAGLNAIANGCDTLVIGYVCWENYSVGLAEKVGLGQYDRFLAEWHIPEEAWRQPVQEEGYRLQDILELVDEGKLPPRLVYDDNTDIIEIDPEATKPAWNCQYCSHRYQCEIDGPGVVPVPVEITAYQR